MIGMGSNSARDISMPRTLRMVADTFFGPLSVGINGDFTVLAQDKRTAHAMRIFGARED